MRIEVHNNVYSYLIGIQVSYEDYTTHPVKSFFKPLQNGIGYGQWANKMTKLRALKNRLPVLLQEPTWKKTRVKYLTLFKLTKLSSWIDARRYTKHPVKPFFLPLQNGIDYSR